MYNQGIDVDRYRVIPRTLVFVRSGERVLLMRRPLDSRVWPGFVNGIGGHVEAGEGLVAGARREVLEETGLELGSLRLAGLLHVSAPGEKTGVLVAVFAGDATVAGEAVGSAGGAALPESESSEPGSREEAGGALRDDDGAPDARDAPGTCWLTLAEAQARSLVPDLPAILPRLWPSEPAPPFVAYTELGNEEAVRFEE